MSGWIRRAVIVVTAMLSITGYHAGLCAEDTCPVWVCDLMGDRACVSWREPNHRNITP